MREIRSPGSVRGAARKGRPYRDVCGPPVPFMAGLASPNLQTVPSQEDTGGTPHAMALRDETWNRRSHKPWFMTCAYVGRRRSRADTEPIPGTGSRFPGGGVVRRGALAESSGFPEVLRVVPELLSGPRPGHRPDPEKTCLSLSSNLPSSPVTLRSA